MEESDNELAVLRLIPLREIGHQQLNNVGLSVDEAVEQVLSVGRLGGESVRLSVVHVLVRALETFLLADDKLLNIARYRTAFIGTEEEIIRNRLREILHVDPPASVVTHFRKCLTGSAAASPAKTSPNRETERQVLMSTIAEHPQKQLRCAICGYHFTENDIKGAGRREICEESGGQLADAKHPRRLDDELKPREYTRLELDHVVPELGLGWTEKDNLQVLCQFCNNGRLAFRRSLEPLSTLVAGSLGVFPSGRNHSITRQAASVAAIAQSGGICSNCHKTSNDVELTVRLRTCEEGSRLWFVPWNVEVVCYECKGAT